MESVWAVEHGLYRLGDEETERLTCPAFRALGALLEAAAAVHPMLPPV